MLRAIEARQATDAWADITAVAKDPERSFDDLHGVPMVEEMLAVRTDVLRAIREAQREKDGQ